MGVPHPAESGFLPAITPQKRFVRKCPVLVAVPYCIMARMVLENVSRSQAFTADSFRSMFLKMQQLSRLLRFVCRISYLVSEW